MSLPVTLFGLSTALALLAVLLAYRLLQKLKADLDELRQRAEVAERSLRQLGTLSSEVAHDVKNPLTAILCSAETLSLILGDKLDDVHRKTLAHLRESGNALLRLVGDYLDISRAETGRLAVKTEELRLAETIESLLGLFQSQALSKNIELRSSVDPQIWVNFDPRHLKRLLFNLIQNAIRFTPDGGEVIVQASPDPRRREVRVAVIDTGVGIHEDRIASIFEPSSSHCSDFEEDPLQPNRPGIGLSLCRSLARRNGGDLYVKSAIGRGSTFWFTAEFISERRRSSSVLQLDNAAPPPLVGQRFLLIEGDGAVGAPIAELISAWGGLVDAVRSAQDAVEALGSANYDAVMVEGASTDGLFPNEIVDLVKQYSKSQDTTVIFSSDGSEPLGTEADRTLQKPYSGEALLKSLLQTGKYSITH